MSETLRLGCIEDKLSPNLSSISCTSSIGGELNSSVSSISGYIKKGRSSPIYNLVNRISLTKLYEEKKAKRCRFYRNGDQWFPGAVIAIAADKHRTWEALLEELTRVLDHPQHLASGVRYVFSLPGLKINSLEMLEGGGEYVASSTDSLKNIDYHKAQLPQWRIYARRKEALHVSQPKCFQFPNHYGNSVSLYSPADSSSPGEFDVCRDYIKPKLITIIRNGVRPRKVLRILLNRRSARSFEQVLNDITKVIKLDSGAVRKVFAINGKQIVSLKDFFLEDTLFIAYGTEKHYIDDFELDSEELKTIQPLVKCSVSPRRPRRMASPQPRGRPMSPLAIFDCSGSLPRSPRKNRIHSPHKRNTHSVESITNGHVSEPQADFLPYEVQSRYLVGQLLGDGNFAVVKHCVNKETKLEFALKIIDKSKCRGKEHMIESEVSILRRINHPHIVSLIEEFETQEYLYLVMELVTGGDLFDAIASATKYTEEEASSMLKDLTSALHYLHEMNIVHRDIKPENLLVEMGSHGLTSLKLGDFGLAVEVIEPLHTVCGTPTYVAPEILAENGYGLKVDIWAAGVIAYILLCGFPPFVSPTNNQEELFDQILRGYYEFHSPYWDCISNLAKELIVNMITVDQNTRYSASCVLNHPWIMTMTDKQNASNGDGLRNSTNNSFPLTNNLNNNKQQEVS